MKILLVNPSTKEIFGTNSTLPLGLAYVAAYLKNEFDVKVVDLGIDEFNDNQFISYVKKHNFDLIGFTATTPLINEVFRLTKLIKENSDANVVAGGAHCTALPEESLNNGIDFVVRNEGEITFYELCKNIKNFRGVKGVSYKDKGKIKHNKQRELLKDLDKLPFPARHLFPDLKRYKGQPVLKNKLPVGSIFTSRGCPFSCIFCYKSLFGQMFRARSCDNIINEWKKIIDDYRVKEIMVLDDAFTTNKKRVFDICHELRKERLDVSWSCPNGIRVDTASLDLLREMKRAGCYRVAFGVESGNQGILNSIGKNVMLSQVEDAFKNAKKAGIETTAFFIIGNPGENEKTINDTIDFAKKVNPDFCQFAIAAPYPGTGLYNLVRENGRFLINDWSKYGTYEGAAYFELGDVKKELVERMYKKAYKKFYLRPNYIAKRLLKYSTYRNIGSFSRGVFNFVK